MKAFELMSKLAKCHAGAEVVFRRAISEDEIGEFDSDGLALIELPIRETEEETTAGEDTVFLDGWH